MARKKNKRKPTEPIQIVNPFAAGVDLGGTSHWVCLPETVPAEERVREFSTDTVSLKELAECLEAAGVTSVAMESTSVHWIPLYELLETRGFDVILTDTRQISSVPGRKSDVSDCQWIQQLNACGLLRGAFRPADDIVMFRELVRMKATLVEQAAEWLCRIQKELDMMNVRVHRAVSDITGKTGMAMLHAIIDGERAPAKLAELRDPRCRQSKEQIERELTGNWRDDHLMNLETALHMYETLAAQEQKVQQQILDLIDENRATEDEAPPPQKPSKAAAIRKRGEEPARQGLFRLCGVDLTRADGVGVENAQVLLSELGPDLSMFPTEKHFISYVRLAPSMQVSGGKKLRGKKKHSMGSSRARQAFLNAAVAVRGTPSALGSMYRRLAARRGAGVARFAVARRIAQIVYRMLRFGTDYTDIGQQAYEERYKERRLRSIRSSAREFGYCVVPMESPPDA